VRMLLLPNAVFQSGGGTCHSHEASHAKQRSFVFQAKPATGFGGFGAASTPSLFGAASQVSFIILPCQG